MTSAWVTTIISKVKKVSYNRPFQTWKLTRVLSLIRVNQTDSRLHRVKKLSKMAPVAEIVVLTRALVRKVLLGQRMTLLLARALYQTLRAEPLR